MAAGDALADSGPEANETSSTGAATPDARTGQVWHPGAATGTIFVAGGRAGQVFTPGQLAGQIHG